MTTEKLSPCKVNLLLNILSKRSDSFHELETVMHPVALYDRLIFEPQREGIHLTCNLPGLPADPSNLVFRAATLFLTSAQRPAGVRIHLEKNIPLAAGLGGGSGNAATTLLALNEMFDQPLGWKELIDLATALGSDVPFFLQNGPALALGRGEQITALDPFPVLRGRAFLLIHPGFGIATAWAYRELAKYPEALHGTPGRAARLVANLQTGPLEAALPDFYNSLEAPAFPKYPVLQLYQEFLREEGALATLMSGSGSTTFAVVQDRATGEALAERFKEKFGSACWTAVVPI